MGLLTHFDVAHLLGHPAFAQLALAMNVYDQARQNGLLDPSPHAWQDCLIIGGQLDMLRRTERKHCVQAVILFQAMMEKVPQFVPNVGTGLSPATKYKFASLWRELISQIKDPVAQAAAESAFEDYNVDFYEEFRNPIIHGGTTAAIKKVSDIRVPGVYAGMLKGWRAYDYLLTEAFAPEQDHQPSWAVMCHDYRISETLDLSLFPDLDDVQGQFNKQHLDGCRSATNDDDGSQLRSPADPGTS